MEKKDQSPKRMKTHLCIPRLRATATTTPKNNHRLSPMTLLERFREAVFRLVMLSALSKDTSNSNNNNSNVGSSPIVKRSYYYPADPHHSEAVADCIEFIKKKAVIEEEENGGRNFTASSSIDAATEMVMPVPVM